MSRPRRQTRTLLISIARRSVHADGAASVAEANAAGLGSFRTYRSRRVASYSGLWSGPARIESDAFGSRTWRRRAPLAAASPFSSAASGRAAIRPRTRNAQYVDIHTEYGLARLWRR